jgi:hypothetical protein
MVIGVRDTPHGPRPEERNDMDATTAQTQNRQYEDLLQAQAAAGEQARWASLTDAQRRAEETAADQALALEEQDLRALQD